MSDLFSLDGKVAVITGAASGIGKATARRFAKAGAKIIVADQNDGSAVADEVGGAYVKTDVSIESDVEALMDAAVKRFGKIDIVINNAGIGGAAWVWDMPEEMLDRIMRVNFYGCVWGVKHGARRMEDGGVILSTASHAGRRGVPTYGAYMASKAAIIGYTKTAALELAHRNIRVNCVCPGTVDTTEGLADPTDNPGGGLEYHTTLKLPPLGRMAKPEEIAATFHYLASDDCQYITGQAVSVDGGKTAGPALGVLMALYEQATGLQYTIGEPPQ